MPRNLAIFALGISVFATLTNLMAITHVPDVATPGTVRVSHLWYWTDFPYLIFNGMGFFGIAWGVPTMFMGYKHLRHGTQGAMKAMLVGAVAVAGGLATLYFSWWFLHGVSQAELFS
jgi:hypothetical protein